MSEAVNIVEAKFYAAREISRPVVSGGPHGYGLSGEYTNPAFTLKVNLFGTLGSQIKVHAFELEHGHPEFKEHTVRRMVQDMSRIFEQELYEALMERAYKNGGRSIVDAFTEIK